uniref:Reverse transcriptase domain-containing protein n=2 Tax=Nicotiana TaxID=4085 RepID=A0A1S3XZR4_TOBAC|nr:PREDICTED: uncharacterized protein LOC104234592 [Nicotiana sylvestris]XP_016445207.1 PREDICTED: uncharacterized protein LOC107770414 [Nicotiana tabacum]
MELCAEVTDQEILESLKAIGDDKAPGIDGYNAGKIADNVILAHELVKSYTRAQISPRCMVKIDLQKAYDSVEWIFLQQVMEEIGFPDRFIKWIMECIKTISNTVLINGESTEPFEAAKGLRQGDHISPFLFDIVMEYLNRSLTELEKKNKFQYHPRYKKLGITHMSFAYDLLLFSRVKVLKIIEAICRSYIWSSSNTITKKAYVSWERMCTPKSVGDLNLINLLLWNKAAIAKVCWDSAHKEDKLWIRWINTYNVKHKQLHDMPIPKQGRLPTKDSVVEESNEVDSRRSIEQSQLGSTFSMDHQKSQREVKQGQHFQNGVY